MNKFFFFFHLKATKSNNVSASQDMKNNDENITAMDSHKNDSAKIGIKAPEESVNLNELEFDEATRAMIEKIQKEDEFNNQKGI